MGYSPNNPLVPGDPYSYDLKWIVAQLNALKSLFESKLDAAIVEIINHAFADVTYDPLTETLTLTIEV